MTSTSVGASPHVITQMIQALALEVAAIRKRGGGTQIELRGGERVDSANGSWLYKFHVMDDVSLRDDTPIRVTSGQADVSGVLVSCRDGVLVVAMDQDLGPKIANARLITDDSFLIDRLKQRLESCEKGELKLNREAADRVFGLLPVRSQDAEPDPAVLLGKGALNEEQLCAVRRSIGSDTTYVWGPPGTGKTTTLARIVEAHYRAGRSVLLISNTNIAVDTALERVAERLKGEPEFHQGLVIRHGPVVKEELRREFGAQVILEEIVARIGVKLQQEREQLAREKGSVEPEQRLMQAALQELLRLEQVQEKLANGEATLASTRLQISKRRHEAATHYTRAGSLTGDLARAQSYGAIRRLFSGLDPDHLQRQIAEAAQAAQAAVDAAQALDDDVPAISAEMIALRSEAEQLTAATRSHPPPTQIRARLQSINGQLAKIAERTAVIERELSSLERQVLNRCRILATTVYRTYLGAEHFRQFDAVVIDEASMLMPPLIYYASGLAGQAVTVAGDFRQLPPIVMSNDALAEKWLKCDIFEKAGIPGRLERDEHTPHLVQLRTQYRMRRPICDLVNRLFYRDHPLTSDPSVNRDADGFPFGSAAIMYVDTAPFHPWASLKVGGYSRYNLFHALLIRNIILHLAEQRFLPPAEEVNKAVGAIAPYAAQAGLIQSLLEDRLGERAAGLAATVHRFQGNEKAAIVLDLTDSTGVRLGRFLSARDIKEDGARLLNVALSRARDHIVLVGNFEYLRAKAAHDSVLRELLVELELNGQALDLDELLPLAERDWLDGLHRILPEGFEIPDGAAGAFHEGTFYPGFQADLRRATESIVILSPFATNTGTARWVEPLRAAMARGVRVRILTRPGEEWGGGSDEEVVELVRGLRELGVTVDLRSRMHEKIAILDGRILWHGSLNILSHRDTHESMLRIESPVACRQLGRFVSMPTARGKEAAGLEARENPDCPKCGRPTVWNNGRFGVFFECEAPECDGKVDPRRRPASTKNSPRPSKGPGASRSATGDKPGPCPRCGGSLAARNGRFGPFLGCTNYPKCRHTEDLAPT